MDLRTANVTKRARERRGGLGASVSAARRLHETVPEGGSLLSRQHRASNLTFLLLALVIFLCMNWIWRLNRQSEELVYSEV